MRVTATLRIGVLLIVAGASISLMTFFWSRAMNAVPLSVPIILSPGQFQSQEFKTRVNIPYRINLVFDSSIAPTELDCLIGMEKGRQQCGNQAAILNVKWRLLSRGQPIATGSSAEMVGASYSYHKTRRHIGGLDALSGKGYTVELDILQDGTRLGEAHPKLEIEPNLFAYEGWLLLDGLAFYVGLLGAAAGIIVILIAIFRDRRFPAKQASD